MKNSLRAVDDCACLSRDCHCGAWDGPTTRPRDLFLSKKRDHPCPSCCKPVRRRPWRHPSVRYLCLGCWVRTFLAEILGVC